MDLNLQTKYSNIINNNFVKYRCHNYFCNGDGMDIIIEKASFTRIKWNEKDESILSAGKCFLFSGLSSCR